MAALQHIRDASDDSTTLKFLTNTGSGMSDKMTIDKDGKKHNILEIKPLNQKLNI